LDPPPPHPPGIENYRSGIIFQTNLKYQSNITHRSNKSNANDDYGSRGKKWLLLVGEAMAVKIEQWRITLAVEEGEEGGGSLPDFLHHRQERQRLLHNTNACSESDTHHNEACPSIKGGALQRLVWQTL